METGVVAAVVVIGGYALLWLHGRRPAPPDPPRVQEKIREAQDRRRNTDADERWRRGVGKPPF